MFQDNLFRELIIDNFAGGGGASTGIELATGMPVDIAINHDEDAISMHKVNHPHTVHYQEDVFAIDPEKVTGGRPVGIAWFSPDCKHFSRAKGGKPVDKKIRGLSWVIIKWAMQFVRRSPKRSYEPIARKWQTKQKSKQWINLQALSRKCVRYVKEERYEKNSIYFNFGNSNDFVCLHENTIGVREKRRWQF